MRPPQRRRKERDVGNAIFFSFTHLLPMGKLKHEGFGSTPVRLLKEIQRLYQMFKKKHMAGREGEIVPICLFNQSDL